MDPREKTGFGFYPDPTCEKKTPTPTDLQGGLRIRVKFKKKPESDPTIKSIWNRIRPLRKKPDLRLEKKPESDP